MNRVRQMLILLGIVLVAASCEKTDSKPDNFKDVKVKAFDTQVELIYDGEKLVKMGNDEFFYGTDNRLVRSVNSTSAYNAYLRESVNSQQNITYRVGQNSLSNLLYQNKWAVEGGDIPVDPLTGLPYGVYPDIEPQVQQDSILTAKTYSYHWEQNKVKRIDLESSVLKMYLKGVVTETKLTNQPYCEFFYKNDRIDSISFIEYWKGKPYECFISYTYDAQGNISKVSFKEFTGVFRSGTDLPYFSESTVYTDGYDKNPNPYYLIYKRLGTLVPSMISYGTRHNGGTGVNYSPNNPLISRRTIVSDTDLSGGNPEGYFPTTRPIGPVQPPIIRFYYEYNSRGLPVNITSNMLSGVNVTYY